jgi:hypothetical protein
MMLPEEEELAARIRMEEAAEREVDTMAEVKELAVDRPDDLASLIKVWVKEEE